VHPSGAGVVDGLLAEGQPADEVQWNMESWVLTCEMPPGAAPDEWNDATRRLVRSFVAAFQGLLRIQSVDVNVVRLAADGDVVGYIEIGTATITSGGDLEIPPESIPAGVGETVVEAVLADCAVIVEEGDGRTAERPTGAEFISGWSTDFEETGPGTPAELHGPLTFDIKDWFPGGDVTPDAANSNRRHLGRALRSWEEFSGGAITEWGTSHKNRVASRYGVTAAVPE
jgi:hypothetical protein